MAENKTDKIIIGIFVAVIIIAVGVFAYYNMYNPSSPSEKENVLLTLSYENEYHNYTLSDLKKIDSFSGNGGYKTSHGYVKGPESYTGVRMTKLLNEIGNLPDSYIIQVIAKDNYSVNYTIDEINGNVTVYDSNGNETGRGGVTMILAYAENGKYDFDDGPLRIAYVDDGSITSSKLWAKWVVEIKVIEI